jgi:hypothetical protein
MIAEAGGKHAQKAALYIYTYCRYKCSKMYNRNCIVKSCNYTNNYEEHIQYSLQIPLIGNTALVQAIAASCTS